MVRYLMKNDSSVHILERSEKEGLGNAYMDAFRRVRDQGCWDRVFTMDADQSHNPRHLPELDNALESYQFVLGSRYIKGVSVLNWSIVRLNMSYTANKYIRFLTGMPFSDCTSGFRGFRAGLLPTLISSRIKASGYAFLVETLFNIWKSGSRIGEVPIVFVERKTGESKVSAAVFLESLLTPLRLRISNLLGS